MKKSLYIYLICLLDIAIVVFSFLLIAYYRTGTRVIIRNYSRPLPGFLIIWSTVSLITTKYRFHLKKGVSDLLYGVLRANFISFAVVLMLFFFFRMFYFSRGIVFGTILFTTIIEILVFTAIYYTFQFREFNPNFSSNVLVTKSTLLEKQQAGTFYKQEDKTDENGSRYYSPRFSNIDPSDAVILTLWQKYLERLPDVFDFVNVHLDLIRFGASKSLILNSSTFFNIEYINPKSQQLFVNLHLVNDFRRINKYFIKVNENLEDGGVFICCGETISQRHQRFLSRSGKIFGNIFYLFDFFFRRVFPKIPFLQGFYFFLTGGRDRSLSETEILGRLYFCGFELIEYTQIDGIMYFILKKINTPSIDENPSYGPLIKLKRVGKNGKLFDCYKIRTMHPYSEYLQEYVHKRCKVSESGKFLNDFRITNWGLFMRKYWIDELPQIINLFKGDLNLIGTRALSRHYFSNYPDDLKLIRVKFKPGLIPVYTADKATTLVELINSERRYLESKTRKSFSTDVKYFSKALFNIVTRQAKSLDTYNTCV